MRRDVAPEVAGSTTGAVPPPVPPLVEWGVAFSGAAPVAILTACLALAALRVPGLSFLNTLCVVGGAGVVLAFYRARRPLARINAGVGVRIGLLTGLLMIACMGAGLALTGVIERFGLHGLAAFDGEMAQQFALLQAQMMERLAAQEQGADAQKMVLRFLGSAEVRAGLGLFYLTTLAGFVLSLTTACGAFTGMLQMRRRVRS